MARSRIREEQVQDDEFLSEHEHRYETPHYFRDLADATTYSGAGVAGQFVKVKADETGLEYGTASGTGAETFLELTDTPDSYAGKTGKYVQVKDDETGLEYSDIDAATISGIIYSGNIEFTSANLFLGPASNTRPHIAAIGPVGGYSFDAIRLEIVYGSFVIPPGATLGTDIIARIAFINDTVQVGDKVCRWCLDYHIYDNLDLYSGKTTTTVCAEHSLPNNAAAGTFLVNEDVIMQHNDANNPVVGGETVAFKFSRDAPHANDTMTGDAILVNITFLVSTGGN
jgi:hypothetical protein